jgi:pyruvate formate lyase activating enzyme
LETSLLDWPGNLAAVLFLPGCNFYCPYCHNHVLCADPKSLLSLPLDGVLERLGHFRGWIDGVVVTGGEPTLHTSLPQLLSAIRQEGFLVKLDSNGSRPDMLRGLIQSGLVDMVAMDLKAPLEPLAYRRAAGRTVDLNAVKSSLELIQACGIPHQFRSTIWPAWHGRPELEAMAKELKGADSWILQALDPKGAWNPAPLGEGRSYTTGELACLQKEIADPVCSSG